MNIFTVTYTENASKINLIVFCLEEQLTLFKNIFNLVHKVLYVKSIKVDI